MCVYRFLRGKFRISKTHTHTHTHTHIHTHTYTRRHVPRGERSGERGWRKRKRQAGDVLHRAHPHAPIRRHHHSEADIHLKLAVYGTRSSTNNGLLACSYVYYKAGLAGQWPFLRVFSAIGRRMAQQRWPMAEDPRLFTDFTLALEPLVAGSSLRTTDWSAMRGHFEKGVPTKWYTFLPLFQRERVFIWFEIYLGPRALTPR